MQNAAQNKQEQERAQARKPIVEKKVIEDEDSFEDDEYDEEDDEYDDDEDDEE